MLPRVGAGCLPHEHCGGEEKQVPPLRRRIRSGSGRNDNFVSLLGDWNDNQDSMTAWPAAALRERAFFVLVSVLISVRRPSFSA